MGKLLNDLPMSTIIWSYMYYLSFLLKFCQISLDSSWCDGKFLRQCAGIFGIVIYDIICDRETKYC